MAVYLRMIKGFGRAVIIIGQKAEGRRQKLESRFKTIRFNELLSIEINPDVKLKQSSIWSYCESANERIKNFLVLILYLITLYLIFAFCLLPSALFCHPPRL